MQISLGKFMEEIQILMLTKYAQTEYSRQKMLIFSGENLKFSLFLREFFKCCIILWRRCHPERFEIFLAKITFIKECMAQEAACTRKEIQPLDRLLSSFKRFLAEYTNWTFLCEGRGEETEGFS